VVIFRILTRLRHLRQCHALKQEQIDATLTNCDDYRRRTATNRKPRLPCPVAGCYTRVTHVGNHLRRKHRTTALAVRRQARTPQVVCVQLSLRLNVHRRRNSYPSLRSRLEEHVFLRHCQLCLHDHRSSSSELILLRD